MKKYQKIDNPDIFPHIKLMKNKKSFFFTETCQKNH